MRILDLRSLYQALSKPEHCFRSLPFWAWNAKLDPEELRRQMADMKEKGIGGAFAHSRDGLETPYLSDEWMRDIGVMADAADELGLEAWVYDEDKWPSGSAGGMVSAVNPKEFTAKALTLELANLDAAEDGDVVCCVRAQVEGNRILRFGEGDRKIILRMERSQPSEWYNHHAPSDNLNADAVSAFIRMTHARYGERFEGKLADHVVGFFTDEPNFCDFFSAFSDGRPWLPWTDDLPAAFARLRGYDPVESLPLLFFEGEGCEKLRHDYWRTLTELFSERFMKQIYDCCEANGVRLTGHMLYENDLAYNIRVCGAAMPQYRFLHMPGVDLLGDQTREWLTVRQCSSVAHQYGRESTIAECYGCTGWELDFEAQKRLGDWLVVNGILRRCQHMMQYSIAGCRKRDYPPVFNYQNAWWEYDRWMEDYFARMAACASAGEAVRSILVIHPISSLWCETASHPKEDLRRVEMNMGWTDSHIMAGNIKGDALNRLAESLLRAHWDFDFGDEIILSEIGAVEGAQIRAGDGCYDVVVVPEVQSLFASTLALLERFIAHGGRMIWMGKEPRMVEGAADERAARLYRNDRVCHADAPGELLRALDACAVNPVRVESRTGGAEKDVLTMLRRMDDDCLMIAVNQNRTEAREISVALPVNGRVFAYDAWNDVKRELKSASSGAQTAFMDVLAPCESRVYFVEHDNVLRENALHCAYAHPHRTEKVFAALGPEAEFHRTEKNALTLDICSCKLNGETIAQNEEVWQAQRKMRDRLGMRPIFANGLAQRYTWELDARAVPFEMTFAFEILEMPKGKLCAAVEKAEGLTLCCNGAPAQATGEWYLDRSTNVFALSGARVGRNTLRISGNYTNMRELEDVFIIGDFAVDAKRRIVSEPEKLHFGDWCLQGYPHYAGSIVYRFELPKAPENANLVLKMGEYSGTLAEVRVNGIQAGVLFGACKRETRISDLMHAERNEVEIRVVGSPRNLLGPLHRSYDGCSRISWEDFRTEGKWHCDGYALKAYGLMGQIRILEEN